MAKEDFCFTFYDGDACRDMSHMNRLERGAYADLIISQRKFGWLTYDQIKKTLGRDFDEVWPAINLVLVYSELEQKYYIDWLAKSIDEMRAHAKKQSENRKGKTKDKPDDTKQEPKHDQKNPLEGGGVDEGSFKIKKESREDVPREVIDFTKPDVEGDEIFFPLDTKPVRDLWAGWKKSRYENHNARYGMNGEQADLKRLQGMTFEQIEAVILAATSGGWKNLYPEKHKQPNGKGTNKREQESISRKSDFAARVNARNRGEQI